MGTTSTKLAIYFGVSNAEPTLVTGMGDPSTSPPLFVKDQSRGLSRPSEARCYKAGTLKQVSICEMGPIALLVELAAVVRLILTAVVSLVSSP